MKYTVTIKEILEKSFPVEASNEEQAMEIVQYHYDRGDNGFVLSSDDFKEAICSVLSNNVLETD